MGGRPGLTSCGQACRTTTRVSVSQPTPLLSACRYPRPCSRTGRRARTTSRDCGEIVLCRAALRGTRPRAVGDGLRQPRAPGRQAALPVAGPEMTGYHQVAQSAAKRPSLRRHHCCLLADTSAAASPCAGGPTGWPAAGDTEFAGHAAGRRVPGVANYMVERGSSWGGLGTSQRCRPGDRRQPWSIRRRWTRGHAACRLRDRRRPRGPARRPEDDPYYAAPMPPLCARGSAARHRSSGTALVSATRRTLRRCPDRHHDGLRPRRTARVPLLSGVPASVRRAVHARGVSLDVAAGARP
jgi:hypothetical protein